MISSLAFINFRMCLLLLIIETWPQHTIFPCLPHLGRQCMTCACLFLRVLLATLHLCPLWWPTSWTISQTFSECVDWWWPGPWTISFHHAVLHWLCSSQSSPSCTWWAGQQVWKRGSLHNRWTCRSLRGTSTGPFWLVTRKRSVCSGPGQEGDELHWQDQWEETIPPLEHAMFSATRVHCLIVCLNILYNSPNWWNHRAWVCHT